MSVDLIATCVLRVRACLNCKPLFSILDGLHLDRGRHYWIECEVLEKNISDLQVDSGQISTGVEILLKMSHNTLTSAEEHIQ
jgi:hypothetical protein